jgi:hypothetical protein
MLHWLVKNFLVIIVHQNCIEINLDPFVVNVCLVNVTYDLYVNVCLVNLAVLYKWFSHII